MSEERIEQFEEESERKPLSEQKKSAFLRYMTILFAVAFTLVLVSLLLQMNRSEQAISKLSESHVSAIANAEALQDQNRAMQEKVGTMQAQIEAMQEELSALEAQKTEAAKTAERTKEAYEALLAAMQCKVREGNVTYAKAMEVLKENQDYLADGAAEIYAGLLGK